MSTRPALIDTLPKRVWKTVALACALALTLPASVNAARRKARRAPAAKAPSPEPKTRCGKRVATVSKGKKPTRHVAKHGKPRRTASRGRRGRAAVGSAPVAGSRGEVDRHVHLRRGDTLEGVLTAHGLDAGTAYPWLAAAGDLLDLRSLHPHRGLTLRFDRATSRLESLRYEIDDRTLLVLESTSGGVRARRETLPYYIEVKGLAGRIHRGLQADATGAGVPERVVADLADIFGWDVDVVNGLVAGDEFRVLYENMWEAGRGVPNVGKVLGAELVIGGASLRAIYFEDADGRGAYFRPSGEALTRSMLRFPVEFTEITSEFSLLRRHPILHRERPHLGVDLAAGYGTPVRAAGTGKVVVAGWQSGLGRCVRLEHADGLTSTYGHLSEIPKYLTEGSSIERGEVIGYVGASGLATGPHLHYEIEQNGEHVDPLGITAALEAPVPMAARRAFQRVEREVTTKLAELPRAQGPMTVSLPAHPGVAFGLDADGRSGD